MRPMAQGRDFDGALEFNLQDGPEFTASACVDKLKLDSSIGLWAFPAA
jgi:hypothetical protein